MKKGISRIISTLLLLPVYFYRWFISPLSGPSCRHTPSCSQYAIDALRNTGPIRGFLLATNRFLRCRPGGTFGYDPAPRIWIRRYRPRGSVFKRPGVSNRLKEHEEY